MASEFRKHWRLVSVLLGIMVLLWVLYVLRTVVAPFAVGLVLAYVFSPAVSWLEKRIPPFGKRTEFKRSLATLVILILVFGIIGNVIYFIGRVIVDASITYVKHTPFYFTQALYNIQVWFQDLIKQFSPDMQQEIEKDVLQIGTLIGNSLKEMLMKGVSSAPTTINFVLGFAALPFFLYYIMKDSTRLKKSFISEFSPQVAEHIRNIAHIIELVLGRYIRAQLMLGLIVGYFAFVGLLLLNVPLAPVLGLLAAVTEIIPTVGPWIGGGVAVIVTLAVAPEKAIWVAVLFAGVQLTENLFLVPRVQSAFLRIHPAVMVVILVLGTYLAGFWGLLLAGPLTATSVEIYKYVRKVVDSGGAAPQINSKE